MRNKSSLAYLLNVIEDSFIFSSKERPLIASATRINTVVVTKSISILQEVLRERVTRSDRNEVFMAERKVH